MAGDMTVAVGEALTLTLAVGGTQNTYQWFKDDAPLAGQTNETLTVPNVGPADAGVYRAEVKNTLAPALTLFGRSTTVRVNNPGLMVDSLALVAFYNATGGTTWTNHTNWLAGPLSTWFGVTLTDGRVTGLDLNTNGLTGPLPAELAMLTNLTALDLAGNQLTDLPDLSGLSLTLLRVENNRLAFDDLEPNVGIAGFSYAPQDSIGVAQDTTIAIGLELSDDALSVLYYAMADSLTLDGRAGGSQNSYRWFKEDSVLAEEVNATLTVPSVGVYRTEVTSPLVPALTLFGRPSAVRVSDPGFLLDSLYLVQLYHSTDGPNWANNTNWLTDPLVDNREPLGTTWAGITVTNGRVTDINLPGNQMRGSLPTEAEMRAVLQQGTSSAKRGYATRPLEPNQHQRQHLGRSIDLSQSFTINAQILPRSFSIGLGAVELVNACDSSPVSDPRSDTGLATRKVSELCTIDAVPAATLNVSYFAVNLGGNQFTGQIPPDIGRLDSLETLKLGNNQLGSGSTNDDIPPELGNLTNLKVLDLGNNQFTGEIPSEIGNLTKLEMVDVSHNQFTGNINQLWGDWFIIQEGRAIGDNLVAIEAHNNQFTGNIPSQIGNLTNLKRLNVSNNQLGSGSTNVAKSEAVDDIPPEMGNLTTLEVLNLGGNKFTGILPEEIGNLTALDSLILANNAFSGAMPLSLTNLTNLSFFNFGDSGLEVPTDSTFQNWLANIPDVVSTAIDFAEEPASFGYDLSTVYPNPFHQVAHFTLRLEAPQQVTIATYSLTGQRVAVLHQGVLRSNEAHTFSLDGGQLAGGVYIIHVQGETFSISGKAIVMR